MSAIATGRRSAFLLLLCPLFAGIAVATTVDYSGAGGPLNDSYFDNSGNIQIGVTTYTIPVTDSYIIDVGDVVTVCLTGLEYPYASDLEVSLALDDSLGNPIVAPIDLFNQIGCSDNGCPQFGDSSTIASGNYMFNSVFTGDLWNTAESEGYGDSIPSGDYFPTDINDNPDDLSSAFDGLPVTGNWVLTVTDYCPPFSDCVSQQGTYQFIPTLGSWGLQIGVVSPVPEPSTIIPLALSGLMLWRIGRRMSGRPNL
jgi:hypothetical protein